MQHWIVEPYQKNTEQVHKTIVFFYILVYGAYRRALAQATVAWEFLLLVSLVSTAKYFTLEHVSLL